MTERGVRAALLGGTLLLVACSMAWSSLSFGADDHRSERLADAGLALVARAELSTYGAQGSFKSFSPQPSDRRSALPQLDLGSAYDDLSFDALLDAGGKLEIRAMSRPDSVRAGRISPLLKTVDLEQPQY